MKLAPRQLLLLIAVVAAAGIAPKLLQSVLLKLTGTVVRDERHA